MIELKHETDSSNKIIWWKLFMVVFIKMRFFTQIFFWNIFSLLTGTNKCRSGDQTWVILLLHHHQIFVFFDLIEKIKRFLGKPWIWTLWTSHGHKNNVLSQQDEILFPFLLRKWLYLLNKVQQQIISSAKNYPFKKKWYDLQMGLAILFWKSGIFCIYLTLWSDDNDETLYLFKKCLFIPGIYEEEVLISWKNWILVKNRFLYET